MNTYTLRKWCDKITFLRNMNLDFDLVYLRNSNEKVKL